MNCMSKPGANAATPHTDIVAVADARTNMHALASALKRLCRLYRRFAPVV